MPVEAIRSQIAAGVDIVVHLERMGDGSRKVVEISEIKGIDNARERGSIELNTLFEYVKEGADEKGRIIGQLMATGNGLVHDGKLKAAVVG